MNQHYHPYSDLSSPHTPSPDSNGYPPLNHHNGHSGTLSQMDAHQGYHHNNNGTPKHCGGCGNKIVERFFLHALDRFWHNSCLKCSCCGAMLADLGSSCFTRSGMVMCKADYSRLFGGQAADGCSACGQMIPASEFVMRTSSSSLQNGPENDNRSHHVFHLKCFACSKCGGRLNQGDRYYMIAGSLVCEQDYQKIVKAPATNPPLRKGKVGRPKRSKD